MLLAPAWRLLYFDAPTRGEQLRCLFHASGTPFEDVKLAYPKGLDAYRQSALGAKSPLAFDQCPCVIHGSGADELAVSQTAAAMFYVGKATGLCPEGAAAEAKCVSYVVGTEEFRNSAFYPAFMPLAVAKIGFGGYGNTLAKYAAKGKIAAPFQKWCGYFERLLEGDSLYLVGDTVSFADVALFEVVDAIKGLNVLPDDFLAPFPKVAKLVDAVGSIPTLNAYLESRVDVAAYLK
ncbi:hypothetical protein M885DRAFT_541636 [Pelagophyceae sp. CCMP2097]|nr:hypothetical protein M885DRAFT_541636 [Pelagophyceae sp. CCMP2097]|mmetsp:Transcript_22316/g.75460  ORF Transcript_22316/g.75460 Transcript_22316/m.75460 type:complete len:235 (-) Transcript_22316:69-773(-)